MIAAPVLRSVAGAVSPRHREWRRLLASLTLDPGTLPHPVPQPGPRDFLICGSPRSGTALLVAMLFQPPQSVTVMEPWDALRLPPRQLFDSLRSELAETGVLSRGRLDIGALESDGAVTWCRDGELPRAVETEAADFLLGVKFPAFWRYLDLLPDTRFLVCLRNPIEVLRSYATTGGRLREGLDYDVPFNREMNDYLLSLTDDWAIRRVLLFDYIHQRLIPHLDRPNVLTVRYERWFSEPEQQLREVSDFLGVELDHTRVRLRPPQSEGPAPPEEIALLRRHCTTAPALGYSL
ncbi:MAG TPA: sulfotransferase [Nocardioidaceae bacterium]|nr:sulfotransferase [Nocardioidaceae bacterium]